MTSCCNIKVFVFAACVLCALGQPGGKPNNNPKPETNAPGKAECAGHVNLFDPCNNGTGICIYNDDMVGIPGHLRCVPFCDYPTELPANSHIQPIDQRDPTNFIGGAILSFSCNNGFATTCPTEVYCLGNGEWTPIAFECVQACTGPLPTVDNAVISKGDGQSVYLEGALLGYECTGISDGIVEAECSGGAWNVIGSCTVVPPCTKLFDLTGRNASEGFEYLCCCFYLTDDAYAYPDVEAYCASPNGTTGVSVAQIFPPGLNEELGHAKMSSIEWC